MTELITEYETYELRSKSLHNRKCIDGKITGCGNCVGYCKYHNHPGFLTQKHREQHDCIRKECKYYLPKERSLCSNVKDDNRPELILQAAKQCTDQIDDIRVLSSKKTNAGWIIGYITVFGGLNIPLIEQAVTHHSGVKVKFRKLDYDFERCVELLLHKC